MGTSFARLRESGVKHSMSDQSATSSYDGAPMDSAGQGSTAHSDFGDVDVRTYKLAIVFIQSLSQCSPADLQRNFKLGYGRAFRILEKMEADGIVGPPIGNKNIRVVTNALVPKETDSKRGVSAIIPSADAKKIRTINKFALIGRSRFESILSTFRKTKNAVGFIVIILYFTLVVQMVLYAFSLIIEALSYGVGSVNKVVAKISGFFGGLAVIGIVIVFLFIIVEFWLHLIEGILRFMVTGHFESEANAYFENNIPKSTFGKFVFSLLIIVGSYALAILLEFTFCYSGSDPKDVILVPPSTCSLCLLRNKYYDGDIGYIWLARQINFLTYQIYEVKQDDDYDFRSLSKIVVESKRKDASKEVLDDITDASRKIEFILTKTKALENLPASKGGYQKGSAAAEIVQWLQTVGLRAQAVLSGRQLVGHVDELKPSLKEDLRMSETY